MMLSLKPLLSKNSLLSGVASSCGLFCKLLGSSGNRSCSISTRTFSLVGAVYSVLRVGPMRRAAPSRLFAELGFEVRPHVIDATQLLRERVVRSRYYMVLLFERYQHLLYFPGGLTEQVSPRDIAWIEHGRMIVLVGRGGRRMAAIYGSPAGAILSARGGRYARDTA